MGEQWSTLLVPSDGAEVLEWRCGRVWREGDGVVRMILRPGSMMSLEDAQRMVELLVQLGQGSAVRVLVDMATIRQGDTATRRYLAGPESTAAQVGAALIVGNPVVRVLVGAWIRLQKPPYPARMFPPSKIPEALAWLNSLEQP